MLDQKKFDIHHPNPLRRRNSQIIKDEEELEQCNYDFYMYEMKDDQQNKSKN